MSRACRRLRPDAGHTPSSGTVSFEAMSTRFGEAPCPDPEALARFVENTLDEEQSSHISNHIVTCERCYDTVAAAARQLLRERHMPAPSPPRALLPALATAIVMAIALTIFLLWATTS